MGSAAGVPEPKVLLQPPENGFGHLLLVRRGGALSRARRLRSGRTAMPAPMSGACDSKKRASQSNNKSNTVEGARQKSSRPPQREWLQSPEWLLSPEKRRRENIEDNIGRVALIRSRTLNWLHASALAWLQGSRDTKKQRASPVRPGKPPGRHFGPLS